MLKNFIKIIILKSIIFFPFLIESKKFKYQISGCFCEGGMVYGYVGKDAEVFIDNSRLELSDDNYFVYAFGRKHKDTLKIKINQEEKLFKIKKKKYLIERINNLPSKKVEPSQKDIKKILKEKHEIQNAKQIDINKKLFSDKFVIPVKGRISGRFGSQRILNGKPKRPHFGLDIAAKKGTHIFSPTNGRVKKIFDDLFFTGKTIIIDHGIGLISIFAHLDKINIEEDQFVQRGDLVGHVGMTGRATGPHLHWGIYLENTPVDPEIFIELGNEK